MPLSNSEIIGLGSALSKNLDNSNYEPAIGILQQLKNELTATDEILKVTKIGLAVGKLRKHGNKKVADLSSDIVRKWKQEIDLAKQKAGKSSSTSTTTTNNAKTDKSTPAVGNGGAGSSSASTPVPIKESRTTMTDKVSVDKSSREPIRNNCIKLLYNALAIDADESFSSGLLLDKAESIESIIHDRFSGKLEGPYKQKMRSLYMNLKGTNLSLRKDVRTSELLPETLCTMSPEEMASDERKALNKKLEEDGIFAAMAAVNTKASTDMFKCSKCGKSETTYYQMQTRSADEPMTTFITCLSCGKRWKM